MSTRMAELRTSPHTTRYASRQEISTFKIPDEGAPADAVHQMLENEIDLNGVPNLNLASVCLPPLPVIALA